MTRLLVKIFTGVKSERKVKRMVTHVNKSAKSSVWCRCGANWQKIFAEFLSTAMLVFLGCMATIPTPGSKTAITASVYAPIAFGMVVMFNIQIFGHISGAFMNPAVTLSSMIFGATSIELGITYMIVQFLGAVVGYGILEAVISMDLAEYEVCVTMIFTEQTVFQGLGIEIAMTTALILFNCSMWDPVSKKLQDTAPIKYGFSILGLSLVGGPYTGASMNPARSFGPAIWTDIWTSHWIFGVGPFLGSIIGTFIYKYAFLQQPKNFVAAGAREFDSYPEKRLRDKHNCLSYVWV